MKNFPYLNLPLFSGLLTALVFTTTLNGCQDPPEACFSVEATLIDQNEEVIFSNCSQFQQEGYSWDFGDGGTSNTVSPIYRFTQRGEYLVVLTSIATNELNNSTYSEIIKVGNRILTNATVTDFAAAPAGGGNWDDADGPDLSLLFVRDGAIQYQSPVENDAVAGSAYLFDLSGSSFDLTPDNWSIILADVDGANDYDTIAVYQEDFRVFIPNDQQQVRYQATDATFNIDYAIN
ncbi:MAG: PKD domain-containing protein, partial [Pseudomonadota bacterium]